MTSSPRPKDVPHLRQQALSLWHRPIGERMATIMMANETRLYDDAVAAMAGGADVEASATMFLNARRSCLGRATLYWVSAEMAAMLDEAAASLPSFELREQDLISPFGFVVFESPLTGIDAENVDNDHLVIDAIEWGVAHIGSHVNVYGLEIASYAFSHRLAPEMVSGFGPFYFLGTASWPFGYGTDDFSGPYRGLHHQAQRSMAEDRRRMLAFHLLLAQEVALVVEATPDRAAARSAARSGVGVPPPVRVVTLRKTTAAARPGGPARAGGRPMQYQEWVAAHWKKQWYPSQNRHIPIHVGAYRRGPKDKPFRAATKVYALRR